MKGLFVAGGVTIAGVTIYAVGISSFVSWLLIGLVVILGIFAVGSMVD